MSEAQLFRYHLAADRDEPLPEAAAMPTIQASGPEHALEQLCQRGFTGELGHTSVGCGLNSIASAIPSGPPGPQKAIDATIPRGV
jgi:hypothetical protein